MILGTFSFEWVNVFLTYINTKKTDNLHYYECISGVSIHGKTIIYSWHPIFLNTLQENCEKPFVGRCSIQLGRLSKFLVLNKDIKI